MLKIYNSLSRQKEEFITLKPKQVSMYVCGITPYDTTHLGHAFVYVFFDTLRRYLEFIGYKVSYTQNVTDIDDSILERAKEINEDWKQLGDKWTKRFLNDMKSLNVSMPTNFVKATDSILKMIEMIEILIKRGVAYEREGNVYFDVKKYKGYGELSRFTPQQMKLISKDRGADPDDPLKKNPLDFLLWQVSKKNEPFWESPWGKGRPGWHIECSAMIYQYLGNQIDIHGGGRDLIYPHHESERAQSESYTNKSPFVKYWVHTAMVMYEGEKMSKSLGNLVLVKDLLKIYSPNSIRWLLLSHYYRTPWEFSYEDIENAQKNTRLVEDLIKGNFEQKIDKVKFSYYVKLIDYDFNFAAILNLMLNKAERINQEKDSYKKTAKISNLAFLYNLLGFKIR